jgi:hypothetical protein
LVLSVNVHFAAESSARRRSHHVARGIERSFGFSWRTRSRAISPRPSGSKRRAEALHGKVVVTEPGKAVERHGAGPPFGGASGRTPSLPWTGPSAPVGSERTARSLRSFALLRLGSVVRAWPKARRVCHALNQGRMARNRRALGFVLHPPERYAASFARGRTDLAPGAAERRWRFF